MNYDLRAEIRNVLDTTDLTDPGDIADKVAKSIPAKALRDVVRMMLRSYVRQVNNERRTYSPPNFSTGGQRRSDAQVNIAAGRSAKVQAIRDGWQAQLDNRVHVGQSEWKFLGDCTYDNLYALAAERETHAAKNASWARYYRSLAGLLTEHGVETVRDLPATVLMPALGGAA